MFIDNGDIEGEKDHVPFRGPVPFIEVSGIQIPETVVSVLKFAARF